MRRMLSFALVGAVLLPAVAAAWPGPGSPAPDFTLPDTAGVYHSLSELSGQVVLINFMQFS